MVGQIMGREEYEEGGEKLEKPKEKVSIKRE